MKRRVLCIAAAIITVLSLSNCSEGSHFPTLSGPYLGQQPPGTTPEIFAPGVISTGFRENAAAFTPGGTEFFFGLVGSPYSVILQMRQDGDLWTKPEIIPVIGRYSNFDFTLSPDGNRLYFTSYRPRSGTGEPADKRSLWFIEREGLGWSDPKVIEFPSDDYEAVYPSIAANGNLYFFLSEGGERDTDIYFSHPIGDGRYGEPIRLGNEINSSYNDWDAYIAPDESYMVFGSAERPDGFGGSDLYVSFRTDDGGWTEAINLGDEVNSGEYEICPYVTADGSYLFYTSQRNLVDAFSEEPLTYEEKIRILRSPGSGFSNGDIYWVDAAVIENLRPES